MDKHKKKKELEEKYDFSPSTIKELLSLDEQELETVLREYLARKSAKEAAESVAEGFDSSEEFTVMTWKER